MNLIHLQDIVYRYKGSKVNVLKNINASFETGFLTAIVGRSGSGKTTLLSLLAGLDQPNEGVMLIDGVDSRTMNMDQYRREKIAMIFQSFHLLPFLNALDNVCYPMIQNGLSQKEAREKALMLLDSVNLTKEHGKRYPTNLSGGEQQRVAIARALATGARFIFADEPTGNLDEENGEQVMEILTSLAHDKGYCIVIVTHDSKVVEQTDRVYTIKEGKIIL